MQARRGTRDGHTAVDDVLRFDRPAVETLVLVVAFDDDLWCRSSTRGQEEMGGELTLPSICNPP